MIRTNVWVVKRENSHKGHKIHRMEEGEDDAAVERETLRGYAVLDKKRGRVAVTSNRKPVSVKVQDTELLARNHGYQVSATTSD